MKEFAHIGEMIAHLATMAAAETLALHHGLKKCAVAIEKTAKSEIGTYQGEVGSFAAWDQLADSTQADRVAKGFTPNDPLKRTGELGETISHKLDAFDAVIGSTSDIMVYQELGTDRIPPRAVLGPAAIRNKELILRTLGQAAAEGLLYGSSTTLTKLE
ncbi:hypothetical protein [Glaciimonas sp. PCH181]|uniref:hypothetical protein n=1 Tax=Glaciimonas sp. PCH181 TaxID=2133943 RepID=UPI000D34DC95|nr:hypothetical protein [Glaciimonas sp. PCH181]PUA19579.1 hypothetical protein C7W93_06960 [Glaciimonas sp. PCH181]